MKVTEKQITLPPYISTTWDNISSISLQRETLVIALKDGQAVSIPGLEQHILDKIFQMHALFLEKQIQGAPDHLLKQASVQFGISTNLDQVGVSLQHDQSLSHSPPLPDEVLKKIQSIASIIAKDNVELNPDAEPHCNCPYCQIARAIQQGIEPEESIEIEEIKDQNSDPWEVEQVSDKLFLVSNKLAPEEHYQVHLGEPVGCTCGTKGCIHLLHVLRS